MAPGKSEMELPPSRGKESKQMSILPQRMPQNKLTIRNWPHMLSNKDKSDTGICGTMGIITGILDGGN